MTLTNELEPDPWLGVIDSDEDKDENEDEVSVSPCWALVCVSVCVRVLVCCHIISFWNDGVVFYIVAKTNG